MKRSMLLLHILVSSLFINAHSQVDSSYFELIHDSNESDGIGILYAGNGYYAINPNPSYTRVFPGLIPNMLRISPAKLIYNDTLISGVLRNEFRNSVSHKYPLNYYKQISKKEYDAILKDAHMNNKWNYSEERLMALNGLKFEDISEADKKRRDLQTDFAKIEEQRKLDSIINIQRRKLLLDLIKTPVVKLEGADTLPIPDPKYFKKTHYFEVFPDELDSVQRVHALERKKFQENVNEILTPFYISKNEVSNGDYQEFIQFLTDSVYLHYSYWNVNNDSLAMTLINCNKKERDSLDPKLMRENLDYYGLKNPYKSTEEFIHNEIWAQVVDTLFNKGTAFELKKELLLYPNKSGKMIAIYPNSMLFKPMSECLSDQTIENYSWHSEFEKMPVLNLSYRQIEAYCAWKERQLKAKYSKQGYEITVDLPTVSEYEFALKSMVPNSVNATVIDRSNEAFVVNQVDCGAIKYQFQTQNTKFLDAFLKDETTVENFKNQQWLKANATGNLQFINGGASEYSSTPVTKELLSYYGINLPQGPLSAYSFVLGSNYSRDILNKDGTAYTKIFYKSIQEKELGSCYNGFRLVYKFVPSL